MNIELPEKLDFLLTEKARYKSAKGGRGSAKSWSFAGSLLIRGMQSPQRFLCCREFQKSIKDSVHQLLADLIKMWGVEDFYTVQNNGIFGKNGTLFGFEGLRHNITNIKSWEGADVAWIEEAQTMSASSWNILPPTIRKPDSELWFSWNPELEEDETWQRLVVNPPKELIQVDMNWRDNPWFPEVLEKERLEMQEKDLDLYENVWEGVPRAAVEGAIFEKELRLATEEGRITHVPYDPAKPVDTFWDLGHSDYTAIWFAQIVGMEYRILNYYSNNQHKFHHYLKYVQDQPYTYGTHYLPHDAAHEQLGQEKTIEAQSRQTLGATVVVPRVSKKVQSIDAARMTFPMCWFDQEKCSDGLSALRRYAYKVDVETGKVGRDPEHNMWSHGADAFQTLGMALKKTEVRMAKKAVPIYRGMR